MVEAFSSAPVRFMPKSLIPTILSVVSVTGSGQSKGRYRLHAMDGKSSADLFDDKRKAD